MSSNKKVGWRYITPIHTIGKKKKTKKIENKLLFMDLSGTEVARQTILKSAETGIYRVATKTCLCKAEVTGAITRRNN